MFLYKKINIIDKEKNRKRIESFRFLKFIQKFLDSILFRIGPAPSLLFHKNFFTFSHFFGIFIYRNYAKCHKNVKKWKIFYEKEGVGNQFFYWVHLSCNRQKIWLTSPSFWKFFFLFFTLFRTFLTFLYIEIM